MASPFRVHLGVTVQSLSRPDGLESSPRLDCLEFTSACLSSVHIGHSPCSVHLGVTAQSSPQRDCLELAHSYRLECFSVLAETEKVVVITIGRLGAGWIVEV